MAIGRTYNVDTGSSTGIAIGTGGVAGTEWVLMVGGTTGEFNISAVRVSTFSNASSSYPSNGTITWRLRHVSGASTGILVGTGTAYPVSQSTTAALSTWLYSTSNGSGTATFATSGALLWSQTLPCTAGANWGEWFTPGFEINTGANLGSTGSLVAITYELGAGGGGGGTTSGVNLIPELVISE